MNSGRRWICWILAKEEIDEVARHMGIDPAVLSGGQYEAIADEFVRMTDRQMENWPFLLKKAIKNTRGGMKMQTRTNNLEQLKRESAGSCNVWICWTLSRREIDEMARWVGLDPETLTDEQYEYIVEMFRAGLHNSVADWEGILLLALETIRGEGRLHRRK